MFRNTRKPLFTLPIASFISSKIEPCGNAFYLNVVFFFCYRRAHLRDCLELLKELVPSPPEHQKATTLALLQSAQQYIQVNRTLSSLPFHITTVSLWPRNSVRKYAQYKIKTWNSQQSLLIKLQTNPLDKLWLCQMQICDVCKLLNQKVL